MKKLVYIMPAILLIAGSCTSQMYLGSGSDDLYYRPSQARKAAVAQTGAVQEKRAVTADIFSGDTLIADNFTEDTLYNNNTDISDANTGNVIPTTEGNLYVYNDFSYPFYEPTYMFGGPLGFDFYYGFGGWYSPFYYSWYSPWYSPYYWGASWYNPYYSWNYGYGYYPYDYYYGGGYHHHGHDWDYLPVARRSGSSSLTGNSYAAGNTGLRTNYARRTPSTSTMATGRYSTTSVTRNSTNAVSRTTYTGNTQNPGYERRTTQGNGQNGVRPDYQTQTRTYTPSYNTPRMSSKPAYNNSRTGSSSSSYSNNSRVSSGNSGSRVQYSSPGRASGASITHSSSPSYSGGSSGGSRGSSVSSSSSSSSSFKSSSSGGGNSGGGGGRRR